MTTMIAEVYDAFLQAGAGEEKSRRAAEALAGHEDRLTSMERRFDFQNMKPRGDERYAYKPDFGMAVLLVLFGISVGVSLVFLVLPLPH